MTNLRTSSKSGDGQVCFTSAWFDWQLRGTVGMALAHCHVPVPPWQGRFSDENVRPDHAEG